LAQRSEPELLQFQQERGSTGFPHYILSRAGIVPDRDWAAVIYVLPPSLVDHLRPRCLALEPADYFMAALGVGATALQRLNPGAQAGGLRNLAQSSRPQGELPLAWFELAPGEGEHRQLLWAAMTLREARAYAHYAAASVEGLEPLGLLMVTQAWQGNGDRPPDYRFSAGRMRTLRPNGPPWLEAAGWRKAASCPHPGAHDGRPSNSRPTFIPIGFWPSYRTRN
jgi:hypothetical protein